MSTPTPNKPAPPGIAKGDLSMREALTFYNPQEEREADKAPLQMTLIRRIFGYTTPYAARRNWLFFLTFIRGVQLPALAWLIGRTINGPIAGRDLHHIYLYASGYFALALVTVVTFHFRQRFALELGEAVVHDMRSDLLRKLMTMPMAFFNQTKFGRIISRLTSSCRRCAPASSSRSTSRAARSSGCRVSAPSCPASAPAASAAMSSARRRWTRAPPATPPSPRAARPATSRPSPASPRSSTTRATSSRSGTGTASAATTPTSPPATCC